MDGENTDLWLVHPRNNTWGNGTTRVDSVYIGATFLRDTTKSEFCIWNWSSHGASMYYGNLSIFIRGGANNGGDTTILLFKNTDPDGTKICLQNNPVAKAHINHLDTIIFKYTWPEPGTPVNIGYSGPNRNPADTAWKARDYIWSPDTSNYILTGPTGNRFKVGRRWCTAGWIQSFAGAIKRTDTVQFGFEDNHAQFDNKPLWNRFDQRTDFDFDDVLFKVDGVFLISPPITKLTFKVEPNDTIMAGDTATIIGKLYDLTGKYVPALSDSITWTQVQPLASDPIRSGDKVTIFRGDTTRFTSTTAYHTAYIVGKYTGNGMAFDTVRIYVKPAVPARLIIEPKGAINNNRANELDTLRIQSNETQKTAYSTIRDRYGNYIRYGNISLWGTRDPLVVTAKAGDVNFGEGIATRTLDTTRSITSIYAVDGTFEDSCYVKLEKFYFTKLRIVIDTSTNPDSLVMNTNQDTTIKVQGLRSSDNVWVDVSATWQNSANLKIDPTAPVNDFSWTFSPSDTGTGWIRVTMNNDNVTKPDSVRVRFTPGPPVRATIDIITPPDSIIAGKPVLAVVKIYDKDGHSYSYTFDATSGKLAAYHDVLERGATLPEPFIIIDGKTVFLDLSPWGGGNQTFVNGRDTVSFTLYNAPLDTSLKHQIFTNLIRGADTIRASSNPFVLHPDKLDHVVIVYPDGTPVKDTVDLKGPVTLISIGYDKYGNTIGNITGNWTVTDSLHQITGPADGSSISYDPRDVIKNERGYIIFDRGGIKDSVYVIITGKPIQLVRAITRDTSGNGILDRMELYFSRKFELPANASFTGLAIVANQRDSLIVRRIINAGAGINDSVWIVELTESHTSQPQTAWTPKIYMPQLDAYYIAAATITATDGAGPVVWRVQNFNVLEDSHNLDTVVVTFSEPVQRWDGGSLSVSDKPMDIFYVWERDPRYPNDTTRYVPVKDMFLGINYLKREPGRNNVLVFTMSNGNDLTRGHYLSLADSARKYVTDTTVGAVRPNNNNRPVRVDVIPISPNISLPFNPIGPIFTHEDPAVFNVVNNENALTWVRNDRGRGAVIKIPIPLPPDNEKEARLKLIIKIYDVIGNVVQSRENVDFLSSFDPNDLKNQSNVNGMIYWNGSNEEGMAVAPGVYRIVVYLQYKNISSANRNNYKDKRMIAKLGIQR